MESAHSLLQMPDWAVKSCPQLDQLRWIEPDQLTSDIHRVVKCFQTNFFVFKRFEIVVRVGGKWAKKYTFILNDTL